MSRDGSHEHVTGLYAWRPRPLLRRFTPLTERRQHMLLVIDEKWKVSTGLLNPKQISLGLLPIGNHSSEILNNVVSHDVVSVQSTQTIRDALRVLYMKRVKAGTYSR